MTKKLLSMAALLTVALGAWAQSQIQTTMKVSAGNRTVGLFNVTPDLKVTWEQHEYIDLGMPSGTLWATCNMGANSPIEFGDYYAWGEVETHYTSCQLKPTVEIVWKKGYEDGYSASSYWHMDTHSIVEWNPAPYDNNHVLKPEYDAAQANWGGDWYIPTHEEMQEMLNNCTWTYYEDFEGTGVTGFLFTSKIEGYTDRSIFLPSTGYINNTTFNNGINDHTDTPYQTASYGNSSNIKEVWKLHLNPIQKFHMVFVDNFSYRHAGCAIRPVLRKTTNE